MIGSVFEQRDQMVVLQLRREEVAAQQAAAAAVPVAVPVAAPLAAMPAAGYAPAMPVFKGAEPDIAKTFRDRGATASRGVTMMPGKPEPENFDRGYLEAGHAAGAPVAEGPRANPMPQMQHRVMPGQPMAAAIPPHVIASFTMGSPSDR